MIVGPVAAFCVFIASKLMDDFPHHLGILIIIFAVLLAAAVSIFLLHPSYPFLIICSPNFQCFPDEETFVVIIEILFVRDMIWKRL